MYYICIYKSIIGITKDIAVFNIQMYAFCQCYMISYIESKITICPRNLILFLIACNE